MTRINQQEGYIAEAAQMIGNARPCPVAITDQMPNTMIPQWHRGSDWAVAHAKRFRDEVAERVRTGAAVSDRERVRLMWIGVGSGMILGPLRRCAIVAAFAAASATAFSAVAPGAAEAALPADAIVLLYASPYGPNHPFSRADRVWMDWVQTRTRGSLTIRPVWSGALLSSDESLTELRHGVADIGLITPIYSKGGVHLIRIHAGFYAGASTFQEQVAMYRCLETRFPEFARELQGLRVLAVQGGALPGILTRNRPVLGSRI
jgi:hypothetical protein